MRLDLRQGDCVAHMAEELGDGSIDMICCDPPYGLRFMGKEFDDLGDGAKQREWHVQWLREAFQVLRPGGIVQAFGGTRTFHHMAAAMEEVGFVLEPGDSFAAWTYGSGFPKSQDVSAAIDRVRNRVALFDRVREFLLAALDASGMANKEVNEAMGLATSGSGMAGHWFGNITQQTLPTKEQWFQLKALLNFGDSLDDLYATCTSPTARPIVGRHPNPATSIYGNDTDSREVEITAPGSDDAARWSGWGTNQKPAWEPVLVGRKPEGRG